MTTVNKYWDVWKEKTAYHNEMRDKNKVVYIVMVDGYDGEGNTVSEIDEIVTFKVKASANVWKSSLSKEIKTSN